MEIRHSDFFDSYSTDELYLINGGGVLEAVAFGIGTVAVIALTIAAAPVVTVVVVAACAVEAGVGTVAVLSALDVI